MKPRRAEPVVRLRRIAVTRLKPLPGNPRRMSEEASAGLAESLKRWGTVEPIVWNEKTGHIVSGHQRLRIIRLGHRVPRTLEVVCVRLNRQDEAQLALALNSGELEGRWTIEVREILEELRKTKPEILPLLRLEEILKDLPSLAEALDGNLEETKLVTIQLFYDDKAHGRFMQASEILRKKYGVEQLPGTVLEAMRRADERTHSKTGVA